jgi:hypothetical protein
MAFPLVFAPRARVGAGVLFLSSHPGAGRGHGFRSGPFFIARKKRQQPESFPGCCRLSRIRWIPRYALARTSAFSRAFRRLL